MMRRTIIKSHADAPCLNLRAMKMPKMEQHSRLEHLKGVEITFKYTFSFFTNVVRLGWKPEGPGFEPPSGNPKLNNDTYFPAK